MDKAFWKNKRVLVTGAKGFIGSAFLRSLEEAGIDVFGSDLKGGMGVVELDTLDMEKLATVCRREKINLIIHCAALDGNAEFKQNNAARIMDENVRMAFNILNVAKEQGIKELVIMSSAEIYAGEAESPIREDDDYRKVFPATSDGYAASKIIIETLSSLYSGQFGLKVVLPRPANVYGPGDQSGAESNRVIPSMIRKVLSGQKIEIWGDGSQLRNFIYVFDLVKAVIRLVESGNFSVFNIATDESISIKKLAELISELAGKKTDIVFVEGKPVGAGKRILDIKKIKLRIDYRPVSFTEGLKKTIEAEILTYGGK